MGISLDGVVALVTGAARGMGAEHVRGLVGAGAMVMATDVLDVEGEALADELGDAVAYRRLDVTNEQDWRDTVAATEDMFGPIGVLVNNAGIVSFGPIPDMDLATWQRTIDINLTGTWLGMHTVVPSMRSAGGGNIVNISSTAGLQGYANLGPTWRASGGCVASRSPQRWNSPATGSVSIRSIPVRSALR